jgi:outer membrane receptor protein involved in Fe transport
MKNRKFFISSDVRRAKFDLRPAVRRGLSRHSVWKSVAGALSMVLAGAAVDPPPVRADETAMLASDTSATIDEITVTSRRIELIGEASSASEGIVTDDEIRLTPAYRPGQLLETVPGLIVTLHSGEGKANQYLLRGYNLDHGTDLATFVDGMPVNQPTHAHGQGYTDLNFMIPELVDGISFTKGPYYANVGDFGAVGSVHVNYRDVIAEQASATIGTLGYQRVFGAGSTAVAGGNLLAGAELQHYDGPFVTPDDARKENVVLRFSHGDERDGYSATLMGYHQLWTNTTDIPERAVSEGIVTNRFGSLDPTDGGHSERASLSLDYHALGVGRFAASGFFEYSDLHIFNDFTHELFDPVLGDQEDQFEHRRVIGGSASYSLPVPLGPIPNEVSAGATLRYDLLGVGRAASAGQVDRPISDAPVSFSNDDQVYLFAGGVYLQAITRWTGRLRSVIGLRDDYQHGTDEDRLAAWHETAGYTNGGTAHQSLLQPKGSLIFTPTDTLEFYASAGRGFHSADVRGVNQDQSVDLGLPHTQLLSKQEGQEAGVRAAAGRDLAVTFAVFNLWQQSETIIDPDVGTDSAGPPSRRYGFELNLTYQVNRHLEVYASYSGDHTRFTRPLDDGTGHSGTFITDAPVATGSLAIYLKDFGPWSGGLSYRYLGSYPLSSGPCVDSAAAHDFPGVATGCANAPTVHGEVRAPGFGEWNLDVNYAFAGGWSAALGIYNLLDTHAAAAEFWYVDRLRSEIGSYPDGRADVHEHPLEPTMARLTVTKKF